MNPQETNTSIEQPEPFTEGVTKAMVREQALNMFQDKLKTHGLTLDDWVQAERVLVEKMQQESTQ